MIGIQNSRRSDIYSRLKNGHKPVILEDFTCGDGDYSEAEGLARNLKGAELILARCRNDNPQVFPRNEDFWIREEPTRFAIVAGRPSDEI